MPNIVFQHLKEHINLISLRENKPWTFNIDLMSTRWKNLKSLASFFQLSIHFHPCHPQQQMTENSFSEVTVFGNKTRPLFVGVYWREDILLIFEVN